MVNINIDTKLLIIGAFSVLLLLRECHHSSEIAGKQSDYENLSSFSNKRDSANLSKINSKVADSIKMSQSIVEYESLSNDLKEELKGYKEGSLTEARVITKVKDVIIRITDTIEIDQSRLEENNCEYADSLLKELKKKNKLFNFKDDWLNIAGNYTYNKVLFDSITFKNEFDVILGYKKEKWYSKRDPVVELKSYNPYSKITYVNNITVKDDKTPYQKIFTSKPAYLIYGILGGLYLHNKL